MFSFLFRKPASFLPMIIEEWMLDPIDKERLYADAILQLSRPMLTLQQLQAFLVTAIRKYKILLEGTRGSVPYVLIKEGEMTILFVPKFKGGLAV